MTWISVKDKLPEKSIPVLVTFPAFNDPACVDLIYIAVYYPNKTSAKWYRMEEIDEWTGEIYTPTHWMPLPDPPKEEK